MRKTPKRSRLEIAKLQLLVEDFARQHGATRESIGPLERFAFDTKYGKLWVSAPQSKLKDLNEDGWLTIFARFEEPTRARSLSTGMVGGANPHTGKWNLHGGNVAEGATAEEVFVEWTRRMRPILRGAG